MHTELSCPSSNPSLLLRTAPPLVCNVVLFPMGQFIRYQLWLSVPFVCAPESQDRPNSRTSKEGRKTLSFLASYLSMLRCLWCNHRLLFYRLSFLLSADIGYQWACLSVSHGLPLLGLSTLCVHCLLCVFFLELLSKTRATR